MPHLNTLKLIEEVKKRPALWDPQSREYKERSSRQRTWIDVYMALFPTYLDITHREQKVIEKVVQQRWKTTRDQYVRCLVAMRTGQKRNYQYLEHLRFLDQKTKANMERKMNSYLLAQECSSLEQRTDAENPRHTALTDGAEPEDHGADVEMNDDLAFFRSLIPIVSKFDDYQKLTFRTSVMNKVMEIGNLTEENRYVNPENNRSAVEIPVSPHEMDITIEPTVIKTENVDNL